MPKFHANWNDVIAVQHNPSGSAINILGELEVLGLKVHGHCGIRNAMIGPALVVHRPGQDGDALCTLNDWVVYFPETGRLDVMTDSTFRFIFSQESH